jgi:hypothetical protein
MEIIFSIATFGVMAVMIVAGYRNENAARIDEYVRNRRDEDLRRSVFYR